MFVDRVYGVFSDALIGLPGCHWTLRDERAYCSVHRNYLTDYLVSVFSLSFFASSCLGRVLFVDRLALSSENGMIASCFKMVKIGGLLNISSAFLDEN